ncbi:MAG TPA: chromate transporter [Candidatus Binatia bacterium]|jgi:chromate transporter|nr:chromate transporter [Candidatus Binatia bacterium]
MEQTQKPNTQTSVAKPAQPATEARSQALPMISLGWLFFRIGATAFGGLGAALALVERELVTKRGMLTEADVTEALTYTKLLPGSTVVQVVSYLGYKLGGWPGSALATAAFIFPSALMMLLLVAGYIAAAALPIFGPTVNGLTAAVVGILLATTYRLGRSNIKEPLTLVLGVVAMLGGAFLGINAALIVVGAGVIGIFMLSVAAQQQKKEESR